MSALDSSALKARNTLLALFVAFCILDAVLVAMVQDWWAVGRILLMVALMYFAFQGRRWAKWLLVTIYSLIAIVLLIFLTALGPKLASSLAMGPGLARIFIIGSWILAGLSVVTIAYLTTHQDLSRYFAWQRKNRSLKR
jgi:hypothetical protein